MNGLFEIPNTPLELLKFFVEIVLIRGILSKKMAEYVDKKMIHPVVKWGRGKLFKSERDVAIWLHYKNKALKKGHSHNDLLTCTDDACLLI